MAKSIIKNAKKWQPTDFSDFRKRSTLSKKDTEKCVREISSIENKFGDLSWVNTEKGISVIDTIKWLAISGKRPITIGQIYP